MYIRDMKIVKNNVKFESLVQIYIPNQGCTTIIFGTKASALCNLAI